MTSDQSTKQRRKTAKESVGRYRSVNAMKHFISVESKIIIKISAGPRDRRVKATPSGNR